MKTYGLCLQKIIIEVYTRYNPAFTPFVMVHMKKEFLILCTLVLSGEDTFLLGPFSVTKTHWYGMG